MGTDLMDGVMFNWAGPSLVLVLVGNLESQRAFSMLLCWAPKSISMKEYCKSSLIQSLGAYGLLWYDLKII
jgi:hypothetical protein